MAKVFPYWWKMATTMLMKSWSWDDDDKDYCEAEAYFAMMTMMVMGTMRYDDDGDDDDGDDDDDHHDHDDDGDDDDDDGDDDDDDDGNDEEDSNGDETTMMMMIRMMRIGWRCFCPSVLTVESLPKRYSSRHTPGIIEKAHGKKIRMSSVFFCIIHKRYSLRSSLRSTHEFCSHCHCLFVILLQSSKVFTSFRELALFHALTHIVVDKSTLRVPEPCRMNCVLTNWWSHLHSAWNVEWHHACAEAWTFTSGKSTVFDPCVPTRIGKMHAFSVSWFMLWRASRTKTQRYKAFGQCFQSLLLSVQHSKKPTFSTVAVVVAHVVAVVLVVVVPLLSFLSSLLLLLLSFISLFSLFSVSCPQPSPSPSASFLPLLFFKPISISNTCVS